MAALIALRHRRRSTAWRWTAAAFASYLVGVMAFTIILNVPMNNAMLARDAANPPADRAQQRHRWDLLDTIRTPTTISVFVGYLIGLMRLVGEQDRTGRG